ncbi:hypothetical protein JY651_09060 [Pyxidicoccus parkwayensis]|uniref:Lipoprotein n=1 Tax=Pyxidicoccus parkwayensis TaxID=2813578 RepID=A0ABX7P3K6_9BACT|nr:hypothetical protein [Pyxidicoccus parkwaysis]QSQ25060.1 hypothetical protein JY651_09060 [Pyxidicoccus parkwaysis]
MPHLPLTRHAWRAALAVAASLAAACGDPKPPPTPDPPQVQLTVPKSVVAGTSFKAIVNVSGCDSVTSLNLYNGDNLLKSFPYTTGDVTLELLPADFPYPTAGMAAYVSLRAEAVCKDGRKNKSQPQPGTFLPVSRVVAAPANGEQVVTDAFVVDGSSTFASFIGCGVEGTGISVLYKVDANGKETGHKNMPIACTADTVITETNGASSKRWLWTPGVGAFAFDSGLNITGTTPADVKPVMLSVLPDSGDAIVVNTINEVRRVSHMPSATQPTTATVKWFFKGLDELIAPPLALSGDVVKIASMQVAPNTSELLTNVLVRELNANDTPDTGGEIFATRKYALITQSVSDPIPVGAFNSDGTMLYLGRPLANNQSQVLACVANPAGSSQTCEGANNPWTSTALPASLANLYFHPASSRVLAIGNQRVWFLDANNGGLRSKDSRSIDANGALVVQQVLKGSGSVLFFLNAPQRTGSLGTLPAEIVAVDQSSAGEARELFRYQVVSSLGAGVDGEGRVWMRDGSDLVQLLSTSEYRRLRP